MTDKDDMYAAQDVDVAKRITPGISAVCSGQMQHAAGRCHRVGMPTYSSTQPRQLLDSYRTSGVYLLLLFYPSTSELGSDRSLGHTSYRTGLHVSLNYCKLLPPPILSVF